MKRVLVIGSGGAGKTTFARQLAARLGLEALHLDALYWQPGWVEPAKEAWRATIDRLVAQPSWVMDGNYSGTLERRVAACDTVIFLDLARTVCLWSVARRALRYRGTTRPDMAAGCPEQLTLEFVRWIWSYPSRTRPKVLAVLAAVPGDRRIVRLRSRREMARFLAALPAVAGGR